MGIVDKLQDVVVEKMLNKIIDTKRIEISVDFKPKQEQRAFKADTPLERIVNENNIKVSLDFVDKTKEK